MREWLMKNICSLLLRSTIVGLGSIGLSESNMLL